VRDAACALRWLQARAAEYGIAPGCIGLLGDSAGGQLAEMTALAGDEPRYLERCEEAEAERPAPRFVVSYYGAHDMAAVEAHVDAETRALLPMLVEAGDDFRAYSPIRFADRHPEVDFFLSHGTFDRLVPHESSIAFEAALREAGHRTALNVIEGAGHGYLSWLFYLSPFREEAEPLADAFIRESLARGPRR
ncbi:MAG: alpha/beta hydrolase, partial [Candidatus Methylomirabilis sp.]|nr:alpha/beta hydrolase [Deltaproteobacteria bacterium]